MKPEFWRSLLGKNPKTKRYCGHCQLAFPAFPAVKHCMSINITGPGSAHAVQMEGAAPRQGQRVNVLDPPDLRHSAFVIVG